MNIDFNQNINRFNTSSKKWDQICNEYGFSDLIPMGIADMDFPVPPEVITALKKRLDHPCFGYTMPLDSLLDTLVDHIETSYNWKIQKEWIILYPTATLALSYILQALRSPKKNIVLQPPVFGPFYSDVKHEGFFPIENPLIFDDQTYTMDFDHLEKLFEQNNTIRALLLCNPQNPIGRVWTREELQKLGEICIRNNCLILSDELHCDLTQSKHTVFGSINEEFAQNCIISMSSSKSFNMAGLKVSFCIIPNPELRNLISLASHNREPNILGMVAYEAAIKAGNTYYLKELNSYIKDNRQYIDNFLNTYLPNIKQIKAEGTFLAWIDMRSLNMSDKDLEDFLIKKVKIYPTFGHTFGTGGSGFIRLNLATSRNIIEHAMERLQQHISQL